MTNIFLFIWVLLILIAFRTLKKSTLKKNTNTTSNKSIILNRIFKFLMYQFRTFIYLYIGCVGFYVLFERMYKYNIFPANIESVHHVLATIHTMNTNEFIFRVYLLVLTIYFIFILPYRVLKLYDAVVLNTNSKDYLHLFIIKVFKGYKNKI